MYLKSISLDNVKGFESLAFDFERPDGGFAGWTVLVGGNGSGKSTLLKAIALALLGPDVGRQMIVGTAGWMGITKQKAESLAMVQLDTKHDKFQQKGRTADSFFELGVKWQTGSAEGRGSESAVPEFKAIERRSASDTRIKHGERGPWNPNARGWFSAGYGPMRRLSGSSTDSIRISMGAGSMSRFVTLFREDAALSESETWLRLNHSRQIETKDTHLATLIEGVKALLDDDLLPHGMKVDRITVDHVYIKDGRGTSLPMRDISDGCRSVYATVLDLVHGMADVYGSDNLFGKNECGQPIVDMPGVVLIDEIDAHLHPRWQRDIPEWLKTHFPRVQFIVSTHSPLVAQAADANGIFVLPSQDEAERKPRRLDAHEVQKIKLKQAEKTLLGTAFGLTTTRSQWAMDQIEKWKRLNAKKQADIPLSPGETKALRELKVQMDIAFEQNEAT